MREQGLDPHVEDHVELTEAELYTEVISAAAAVDRPLTVAEIDNVLGVRPGRSPQARPRRSEASGSPRSRAPSPAVVRGGAVSAARVYRWARRQAAAEQPPLDVHSGLRKLNQWMSSRSDGDSG